MLLNLTPHTIVIIADDGTTKTIPTMEIDGIKQVARVKQVTRQIEPVDGLPCVTNLFAGMEGVDDSVWYKEEVPVIVSTIVAAQVDRRNVYVPDTGPESAVRNSEGQIVGVKRLIKYS